MKAKKIGIGLIMGLIANSFGLVVCAFVFSKIAEVKRSYSETIVTAIQNGTLGSLITLGAILNLIVFFVFIKQNKIYEARGVLLATLIAAICIVISKFG